MTDDATGFLLGSTPEEAPSAPRWFPARYDGSCDTCGTDFGEGDEIRSDGSGGWEAEVCCGTSSGAPERPRVRGPKLPLSNGRYVSTHPVTGKLWRATRVTNFIKIPTDHMALDLWKGRMAVLGMALRPDLVEKVKARLDGAPPHVIAKRDRDRLNTIVDAAKDAAGGKDRARHGTVLHKHAEEVDGGTRSLSAVPAAYLPDISAYREAIAASRYRVFPDLTERTTAHAGLGVVGTFDRIVGLPDGTFAIMDMKTGADLSYNWLEIAMQMAVYAHGVSDYGIAECTGDDASDPASWTWEKPVHPDDPSLPLVVRRDVGIVAHLPYGERTCTLYEVPLDAGWQGCMLAAQVRDWRKTKITGIPVPRPDPEVPLPMDDAEQSDPGARSDLAQSDPGARSDPFASSAVPATWEERFAAVASRAEASALYAAARGEVGPDRLSRLVALAQAALS